jgi:transcriptional regulator with XRE-family HTH domain|uniref:helix-turn-helix domain-containing protein n=1 Tax=Gemmiger formicilis TaxID=745368 RepID=UPI004024B3A0
MTFYQKYVALCTNSKITPSAAAQKMGISKTTVHRWKNGGGVTDANLQIIANYFGVPVDDLIGDDSAQKEKPTAQGGGLTEKQKYAIELIKSTSDDDLDKLIEMFKIWAGKK